jgi:hypothetical protein
MTFAIPNQGNAQGFLTGDVNVLEDLGTRYSRNSSIQTTYQVDVSTVDWEISQGRRPPDLLKIDVEGNVFHVLQGARAVIQENVNMVVEFEGDYSWMAYRNQIIKILGDRVVYRILPSGEITQATGYFDSELYAYCDLIALPPALLRELAVTER